MLPMRHQANLKNCCPERQISIPQAQPAAEPSCPGVYMLHVHIYRMQVIQKRPPATFDLMCRSYP